MKKIILSAASLAVAAVASVSVVPTTAEAVPAFARQTGAACLNCHFQAIPRLAAMGREFRAGGFTDVSSDLIEDDHLSLPVAFGASVLFKARMGSASSESDVAGVATADDAATVNLWDSGTDSAFQYPDEAALLMGGRLGEHTGALAEWNGGPLSYKIIQKFDMDAVSIGVILASTDALGLAYAFNDASNAMIRNTRGSQFRPAFFKNTSIQTPVTGYGVTFDGDMFHASIAQFANNGGTNANSPAMPLGSGLIHVVAQYIGDVAGFDTVAGVYSVSGTQDSLYDPIAGNIDGAYIAAPNATTGLIEYSEATTGVNVQMQGEIGDALAGLYFVYQTQGKVGDATGDLLDSRGLNILGTYSVSPVALVKAGYAAEEFEFLTVGGNTATADTFVLGGVYDLAQNFALDLEYTSTTSNSGAAGAPDLASTSTTLLFEYLY